MAYRMRVGGVEVAVDTIHELEALLELHDRHAVMPATPAAPAPSVRLPDVVERASAPLPSRGATGAQWRTFYERSDAAQQGFLKLLAQSRKGLFSERIRESLGLTNNLRIRGMLISLTRRAKNIGLPRPIRTQVIRVDRGRRRRYQYSLATSLFDVLQQEGRPEEPRDVTKNEAASG